MNIREIKLTLKLATSRRNTLIKRLQAAQAKFDDRKCDQIVMRLQGENEIIGDCRRLLETA